MTWFKVDDRLHAHPKALATSLAALGLWTAAGSWSSDHLTDGFMPDHVIPLLSRGTSELADELVAAGLWRRVKGGYRFHQWHEDSDGSRRNPTKKEVEEERRKKADAGRKGGLASGKARSKPPAPPKADAEAPASGLVEPPTRPDPYLPKGGTSTHDPPDEPPPRKCQQHQNVDRPPPCGACADARRAHDAWHTQHQQEPAPPPGPSPWMPPDVHDVLEQRTNGYEPAPAETVNEALARSRQHLPRPHAPEEDQ